MNSQRNNARRSPRMYRGNTLVLVTAILVLLVIIATAFISRTQTGRKLAVAQQHAFQREASASVHADAVADEISRALFPRDIDPGNQAFAWGTDPATWIGTNGDLAELTLSGVPRKSDSSPWLMNSSPDPSNPDLSLDWLNNQIAVERFGPDSDDNIIITDPASGTFQMGSDGIRDRILDFNFAPFETRPWTNWPDDSGDTLLVPYGAGALDIVGGDRLRDLNPNGRLPFGTGNPRGNPGFGDTRWLRDTEPRRIGNYYDGPGDNPATETYSHWTHLSWLPTAENGWRVCPDISNVAQFDGNSFNGYQPSASAGYTLSKMAFEWDFGSGMPYHDAPFPVAVQTPYEQWYPNVIPTDLADINDLFRRRNLWFSNPAEHFNVAMRIPNNVLPNYFDLDLWGPDHEKYVLGTWRNAIERTFADTDGDGFTDSFWFVPPASSTPGVRQIVGISVIDNNSMLDANVATSFDRWSTSGATPADVALVSRVDGELDTWVGLFNDPKNRVTDTDFYPTFNGAGISQAYNAEVDWFTTPDPLNDTTFLNMRGLRSMVVDSNGNPGPFYGEYRAVVGDEPEAGVRERKLWNRLAQNEFKGTWINTEGSSSSQMGPYQTTRFDMTDEIELRSFNGLNHPTRYSRFERAVNDHVTDPDEVSNSFLRSHIDRPEVAPVRDGTMFPGPQGDVPVASIGSNTNVQQVRDNRHRITFHTGARNEFRPLWLWQTPKFDRTYDYDRDGASHLQGDWNDFDEYQLRRRKIDLRQTHSLPPDVSPPVGSQGWLNNRTLWLNDLQDAITRATTVYGYDPITDRTVPQSYFCNPEWDLDDADVPSHGGASQSLFQEAYIKSLKMAASYAANIEAFRDGPEPFDTGNGEIIYLDPPMHPYYGRRVPYVDPNDRNSVIVGNASENPLDDLFLGFEKQPFIMQAYFGLVYPKTQRPEAPPAPDGSDAWEEGYTVPDGLGFPKSGEHFVDETSEPAIVIAVQLGNPFDEPLSLYDFKLQFGELDTLASLRRLESPHPRALSSGRSDNIYGDGSGYHYQDFYLGPTEPDAPRSVVIFAVVPPTSLGFDEGFEGSGPAPGTTPSFGVSYEEFKQGWLDTLDLLPGELFGYEETMDLHEHQTLVLDASRYLYAALAGDNPDERIKKIFGESDTSGGIIPATETTGTTAGQQDKYVVRLVRSIEPPAGLPSGGHEANVVLDRLQHNRDESNDPRNTTIGDVMARLGTDDAAPTDGRGYRPPKDWVLYEHEDPTRREWAGIRIKKNDFFLTWVRVSRIWGWDVDANGIYDMDEISPRYVFSVESGANVVESTEVGYIKGGGGSEKRFTGDSFSITGLAPGMPDQNLWMKQRDYTLPLTKIGGGALPAGWDWQNNTRPPAYSARGKPTNFPTWTVVSPDSVNPSVEYGNGFPLEVIPNNDGSYQVQQRTVSPQGAAVSFTGKDIIPMDLGAEKQEEFYKDFRQDLWSKPLQMLLKDDDIEQIGELTHVFLWGPVFELPVGSDPTNYPTVIDARRTFSELMTEVIEFEHIGQSGALAESTPGWWDMNNLPVDDYPVGTGVLANRLDIGHGYEPVEYSNGRGFDPGRPWRQVLGAGVQIPAYRPYLPAGSGIFDAVTVDARGSSLDDADLDGNGTISLNESVGAEENRFDLARGFTGEPTRGLININTASVEVMRTLPQMSRLIYNDYFEVDHGVYGRGQAQRSAWFNPQYGDPTGAPNNMHVRVAESIERYRSGDVLARSADGTLVPSMADRGFRGVENDLFDDYASITPNGEGDFYGFFPGMRNDRGIVSVGELLTLQRTQYDEGSLLGNAPFGPDWRSKSASIRSFGDNPYGLSTLNSNYSKGYGYPNASFNQYESAEYARERYFLGWRDDRASEENISTSGPSERTLSQLDARVSTDRNTERRNLAAYRNIPDAPNTIFAPDMVGGDAEEMNMIFSGMANLLTTRSDVFTIYMRIRSFKQDPVTGVWDATRKENVIDESRYMVVIDRSTVGWPTEQPRILSFSKIE